MQQFIDDYQENKLKKFIKSEPIPEVQLDEFVKVVGHTYNEIV